jgi:aminoglycoside phosphotransferase (APT) family kinase protein
MEESSTHGFCTSAEPKENRSYENLVDAPGPIRPGESISVVAVDRFLKDSVPGLQGTPRVWQFPKGVSKPTYLIRYENRDLVLRRMSFETKAEYSVRGVVREAKIITAVSPFYPAAPKVVALSENPEIIGSSFYVMERLHGIILRRELPAALRFTPVETRRLCVALLEKLIALHQIDYRAHGLQWIGKGEGYLRRQVERWSDRFRRLRPGNDTTGESIVRWLNRNIPAQEAGISIVHNDFRFDNVVLDPTDPLNIIGVLDWEMATLGDPLLDLGASLAYWTEPTDDGFCQYLRLQPTTAPGMFTRYEVIKYYLERTGHRADSVNFCLIFGFFRLAVILQQFYSRFLHNQDRSLRFATFSEAAQHFERRCLRLIERPLV